MNAVSSAAASGVAAPGRDDRPNLVGIGVVVWLASELMFFSGLFAAWFTLRGEADVWPPEGVELEVLRTGVATLVLVASSFTIHRGVTAARADDRPGAVRWLAVTIGLALVFLGNQAWEYAELGNLVDDHSYGSIFYLMTGFHGLHVLGGVVLIGFTIRVISRADASAPLGVSTDVASYYWHFVDGVWVVMFATIYLLS